MAKMLAPKSESRTLGGLLRHAAFAVPSPRDFCQGYGLFRRKTLLSGYCFSGRKIGLIKSAQFVKAWRQRRLTQRPFPGFSPHVYLKHNPNLGRVDPTLHFEKSGRPNGPWIRQVITPLQEVSEDTDSKKTRKLAIHIHVFYVEELPTILSAIGTNKSIPDIFITFPPEVQATEIEAYVENYDGIVRMIPLSQNVGRDIGPFFSSLPQGFFSDYELVAHVHTKRSIASVEAKAARRWFEFLTINLFGSGSFPGMLDRILSSFSSDPKLGLVYPDDPHVMGWTENYAPATRFFPPNQLPGKDELFDFPMGTFFIARPQALAPLRSLNLMEQDYPAEPVGYDGTILHALERLIGVCPELTNLRSAVSFVPGQSR